MKKEKYQKHSQNGEQQRGMVAKLALLRAVPNYYDAPKAVNESRFRHEPTSA